MTTTTENVSRLSTAAVAVAIVVVIMQVLDFEAVWPVATNGWSLVLPKVVFDAPLRSCLLL